MIATTFDILWPGLPSSETEPELSKCSGQWRLPERLQRLPGNLQIVLRPRRHQECELAQEACEGHASDAKCQHASRKQAGFLGNETTYHTHLTTPGVGTQAWTGRRRHERMAALACFSSLTSATPVTTQRERHATERMKRRRDTRRSSAIRASRTDPHEKRIAPKGQRAIVQLPVQLSDRTSPASGPTSLRICAADFTGLGPDVEVWLPVLSVPPRAMRAALSQELA